MQRLAQRAANGAAARTRSVCGVRLRPAYAGPRVSPGTGYAGTHPRATLCVCKLARRG